MFILISLSRSTAIDSTEYIVGVFGRAIEALPPGVRVADGLMQSTAVRAAGFSIVSLSALAPAVKVLYVIMRESCHHTHLHILW